MATLRFTTIQAPNQDFIIAQVCEYLSSRLGLETEFVIDLPWQERARRLDAGLIEVAWICGLPYIERVNHLNPSLELLAAPVMAAPRYQDSPVYFSDVIVRQESPYKSFEDLRGARWAYNEPHSHSGYNITRYYLARLGAYQGFFGSAVQAGSHQRSIQMVVQGDIDAAAIDSTVLELELERDPSLESRLRLIASLGPSPIPPLVVVNRIPLALRLELRQALLEMHQEQGGRRVLSAGKMARYAAVTDADYDPIREMTREAHPVHL
jgi:phosphonate transport system substrate-binding protein